MEIAVYNIDGKESGEKLTLPDEVFGIEPNDHAIYQDVVLIQAHQRQGTHKVKGRGEVQGSTKKPYKQKGTGNARAGHKRSPLWRHGGTVHGPVPHLYGFKLNKKVKRLARRSAVAYKVRENRVTVLNLPAMEVPKTKAFVALLGAFDFGKSRKVLFVTGGHAAQVFEKSGRNLSNVVFTHAGELNTYDILNADHLVLMRDAVEAITETLS